MLTAVSQSLWWYKYSLSDETGREIAVVEINWGESGRVTIGGEAIEIMRVGLTGPWQAWAGSEIVASIIKPSFLSRELEIDFNGARYQFMPHYLCFTYDCYRDSRPIGTMKRRSFFGGDMSIDLPGDLPLKFLAIATWAVLLMWRRASQSS